MTKTATNERIVKFRLVTYWEEIANQVTPQGDNVLVERTASLGEHIDLRPADEERLDSLGALYSTDEAKAIEDGTYRGQDRELLFAARAGTRPAPPVTAADGEGNPADIDSYADPVALGEYIAEARPNIDSTLALLPDDPSEEQIQKLYDAENIATDNTPRAGVVEVLDRLLAEKQG